MCRIQAPTKQAAELPERWYEMSLNVYQNITIHYLRVEAVTNASVLQIGSAGSIRSLAQLYNTGGYAGPVPQLTPGLEELSLIRLPSPS